MTIAAIIQSQMLQTLLQALTSPEPPLMAGETVTAKFVGWAGGAEPEAGAAQPARAEIEMGGRRLGLLITATPERLAALQPGARLTLQVDEPETPGNPAQMRLLSIAGTGELARAGRSSLAADQAPALPAAAGRPPPTADAAGPAVSARAAAGPLVGAALGRQNGLGPLFADLAVLAKTTIPVPIPLPVSAAVARVLSLRLPTAQGMVAPAALERAVQASGVFHEARLAAGDADGASADLKGALLDLRQALKDGLALLPKAAESGAPPAQTAATLRPPPPMRDGLPAPQPIPLPSIDPATDSAAGMMARALERTEGALDRISLGQFASLPPAEAAPGAPLNRWFTELPIALDGRTAVLPLEIEEDHAAPVRGAAAGKLWRVRLALDVEPMGPLHAMVTLQGRDIAVAVWAERDSTSRLVREHAPDLKAALLDGDFAHAEIEVIAGQPLRRPASAGAYLDRRS